MKTQQVIVVPYNEVWKQEFETIKEEIIQVLDGCIMAIEHVGSSSEACCQGV